MFLGSVGSTKVTNATFVHPLLPSLCAGMRQEEPGSRTVQHTSFHNCFSDKSLASAKNPKNFYGLGVGLFVFLSTVALNVLGTIWKGLRKLHCRYQLQKCTSSDFFFYASFWFVFFFLIIIIYSIFNYLFQCGFFSPNLLLVTITSAQRLLALCLFLFHSLCQNSRTAFGITMMLYIIIGIAIVILSTMDQYQSLG